MKTLIETSIEAYGIGHPDTKTIFNLKAVPELAEDATPQQISEKIAIENENQRITGDLRFTSLTKISGRKLTIWFKYTEDSQEKTGKLQMVIPRTTDEEEIKTFILAAITNHLSS